MPGSLTPKETRLLTFLADYMARHHQAPTLVEIAAAMGTSSKGSVHLVLGILEAKGYIGRRKGYRGIELVQSAPMGTLPLLGRIAAGKPIEGIADQQSFNFLEQFGGANRYVLQVRGQSMEEEGIMDGDWVVIERGNAARNGQIVAALIDNTEVTLKRIRYVGRKMIRLMPANKTMEPMDYAAERVAVQGTLVGQMRAYR